MQPLTKLAALLCLSIIQQCITAPYFPLWLDPKNTSAKWYDLIQTSAGQSFVSTAGTTVNVNMGQGKGGIHLYADPTFQQFKDDAIRNQPGNNPEAASLSSGTIDACGWPDEPAATAPKEKQNHRRTTPMVEDFSEGLSPERLVVGLQKGCCSTDKYSANKYHKNLNIVTDEVQPGVTKPVLKLTAYNADNPDLCANPQTCRKDVTSSGTIASADIFASGRYEVIAKVPAVSGLVWAIWTFHYEEHLPNDCARYECWCARMPSDRIQHSDACEFRFDGSGKACKYADLCDNNQDGWNPSEDPPAGSSRPSECATNHTEPDPQFLGNDSFTGWVTTVNHEIDIEIPANCVNTSNVCNSDLSGLSGVRSCTGDFSTANLNNYIYTQNSGSGPAYANMCVKATREEKPLQLVGDGKYHNYSFNWHTGNGTDEPGKVDFYFDSIYLGTNNAFVPTRGSRLWVAHWYPASKGDLWNGSPDDWGGGQPGDGNIYTAETFISEIRITPFNEQNDMMSLGTKDKPGNPGECTKPYNSRYPDCHPARA